MEAIDCEIRRRTRDGQMRSGKNPGSFRERLLKARLFWRLCFLGTSISPDPIQCNRKTVLP